MKKQREITWTGQSGRVTAIVTAEHGVRFHDAIINADGNDMDVKRTTVVENTDITVMIAGRTITGMFISEQHAKKVGLPMVLLASKSPVIGISDKKVAEEIAEAVAEVKAETIMDKDYQKVIANRIANRKTEEDYQDSRDKINKAMSI